MTTPIERAREAARDALIAEADRFAQPVQYYITGESASRAGAKAELEGRDALDAADDKRTPEGINESYQYLSDAAVNGLLASLSAQGLVIVPKEASEEMVETGYHAFSYERVGDPIFTNGDRLRKAWAAMIAASPHSIEPQQRDKPEGD